MCDDAAQRSPHCRTFSNVDPSETQLAGGTRPPGHSCKRRWTACKADEHSLLDSSVGGCLAGCLAERGYSLGRQVVRKRLGRAAPDRRSDGTQVTAVDAMAAALGTACCVAASSGVARVHRSSSPSSGGPRFAVRRQRGARLTVASTSGREETSSDVSTAVRSAQRAPAKAVRLPIAQIAAVAGLLALVHPGAYDTSLHVL